MGVRIPPEPLFHLCFVPISSLDFSTRAGIWKRRREDLKNRRIPLFKRYAKTPNHLHLPLEIKAIDDQIVECTQQLESENRRPEPMLGVQKW